LAVALRGFTHVSATGLSERDVAAVSNETDDTINAATVSTASGRPTRSNGRVQGPTFGRRNIARLHSRTEAGPRRPDADGVTKKV
jgi:hypothetical protein